MAYFEDARWEEEWIETAKSIIVEEYARKYDKTPKGLEKTVPTASVTDALSSAKKSKNMFDLMPRRSGVTKKAAKSSDATPSAPLKSELDIYLEADTEEVDNALEWWWKRRDIYPNLSCMALDYLTIPGAF
ncbi:hypothetical protein EIP86_001209 [Pleurotus ostreatoroseus]|nr:hypothetical protein EIP86_001209 [Pleurotus ostreatoroseus]